MLRIERLPACALQMKKIKMENTFVELDEGEMIRIIRKFIKDN